mmetsp:Transcript_16817/g.21849  ORF Transcript_16817/g.21849 Transcript_16817/m.21849 type:complete len:480 (+) Transcript_16817:86-1525(+)
MEGLGVAAFCFQSGAGKRSVVNGVMVVALLLVMLLPLFLTFDSQSNSIVKTIGQIIWSEKWWVDNARRRRKLLEVEDKKEKFRILHVVTSLSEFNNGHRNTIKGDDRLVNTLIPALRASVESMASEKSWHVDVFLVLGFTLEPERKKLIVDALPDWVGLEVWDDATPLYYDRGQNAKLELDTRALARQHRFVFKDKLEYYDFFSAWEDDMVITADHIRNFIFLSNKFDGMREHAPNEENKHLTIGKLSKDQLKNIIPGFIRVEVLKGNNMAQQDESLDPIPISEGLHVNGSYCCSDFETHLAPSSDRIILWETGVAAMGVRKLSEDIGWVATLPGRKPLRGAIESYWSGMNGAYGDMKRPGPSGNYFANAAGIMLSRKQIHHLEEACKGGYLPPYTDGFWHGHSGLKPQNVEFWSGGYHVFSLCGLQRILSLEKDAFSKHLIYHSANNKQEGIARSRLVKADNLLGQLHSVVKAAESHK